MRNDAKIKRIIREHGAVGYAVYCYILEAIAGNLESKNPLPDLEETSEDLAYELRMDTVKVQRIVDSCIKQNLFSQDEITGRILCLKMYKFLDDSTRKSQEVVNMLSAYKKQTAIKDTQEKAKSRQKLGKIPKNSEKNLADIDRELDLDKSLHQKQVPIEDSLYKTRARARLDENLACQFCGAQISAEDSICPSCNETLELTEF